MPLFSTSAKKSDFFALDISSSSIKVLQLSGHGDSLTVEAVGQGAVNRSVVADKSIVDNEALAKAIDAVVKEARIKTKRVFAAMPASQATNKVISMPDGLSILEQEDYIQLEAANHLPFAVEDVKLDFEIIGTNKNDSKTLDVLLVAAKNDSFQNRADAILSADLNLDVMDVEDFAVVRAMNYIIQRDPLRVEDPIEVVIDLGHEFTSMNVIKNGASIYVREQSFGMKQLIDEIMRRFGVSASEAQNSLIHKKLSEDFMDTILPQFRQETANQVNRLIQFFFAATSFNRVHRIWLAGGGGNLDGLTDEINQLTGVPTKVANPFAYTRLAKNIEASYLHHSGPALLTAFGLAIREN